MGPTGAGKSELAFSLAETFAGEIIGCDSVQVFRHFDLGSAKTPLAERRGIPHHLIDIRDPDELFTAGDYAVLARELLGEIHARGRLPVIAGGTGFYLRALLDGLADAPKRDEALRERLTRRETLRKGSLHRLLRRLDSDAARRIHANDVNKLMRALEICVLASRPQSEVFAGGSLPLRGCRVLLLGLDPPRAELYRKLDARSRAMFTGGLLEEVRSILDRGYSRRTKPFESLAYKEALRHLSGELSLEEAIRQAQRDTRRYAKRQLTWFRRQTGVRWLGGFGDEPRIVEQARQITAEFLGEAPP